MHGCDRCLEEVPAGEFVVVSGGGYCRSCGIVAAAEVLGRFLAPFWEPELASLREGEEALRVLQQLAPLAGVMVAAKIGTWEARVGAEP